MQLRHAKGAPRNWFLDKLLEGERPVSAVLEVKSGGGMCTVYLRRLDVSSVTATGAVLDFLIKNFFLSLYPSAKIGEPFEMDHHIESIAIRPNAIYVRIGRGAGVKRPPAAAAASGRH
jgi:hypothetical protein